MAVVSVARFDADAVLKRLFPQPKNFKLDPEKTGLTGQLYLAQFSSSFEAAGKLQQLISDELSLAPEGDIPLEVIHTDNGTAESYTLEILSGKIVISASSRAGALYGAMTLRQLKSIQRVIPCCRIEDHPSLPQRIASRWTICAECTRSAMDFGDGVENYLRRCREMIDFLMRIKVNVINFDGYRWETEKFPGYAEKIRELNAYAFDRNIRLVFGGYGIGIGGWGPRQMIAEAHNFLPGFYGEYNRLSYPDGEIYDCCGNNPRDPRTRQHGTCRSNEAFLRQVTANVRNYVSKIHPRAISVHHEDICTCTEMQQTFWDQRCSKCRERYPDDRFEAYNGAAAAVARGYNAIMEGVISVKEEDYDGARDCLLRLASPGYGNSNASDEEWERIVEYWKNVCQQVKHHALIAIREQFVSGRMARLQEVLDEAGGKLSIGASIAGGADFYTNDAFVTASPALCGSFDAAGVFLFSGLPFQAVQMVINSEFSWNSDSSWYKVADKGASELRNKICYKGFLPEEFTRDKDGLVAAISREIYGPGAGEWMTKLCLLGTDENNYPASSIYYMFRIRRYFLFFDRRREESREAELSYWRRKNELTRAAIPLLEAALAEPGMPENHREVMAHTLRIFRIGVNFTEIAGLFFEEDIDGALIEKKLDEVEKLHPQLFPRDFIAPGNGEAELFPEYIALFRELLERVRG